MQKQIDETKVRESESGMKRFVRAFNAYIFMYFTVFALLMIFAPDRFNENLIIAVLISIAPAYYLYKHSALGERHQD